MRRADIVTVGLLAVLVIATQVVRSLVPESSIWSGFSAPQVVLLPFFALVMWRVTLGGVRIPRSVVALSTLCALGSVAFAYSWRGDRATDFLVARLAADPVEARSKVLRDAVNAAVPPRSEARAVRYFREIDDVAEARRTLARNPGVPAIVWGSDRTLTVTFATEGGIVALDELGLGAVVGGELALVTRVSRIDIGAGPAPGTARFLGRLFAGILPELRVGTARIPGGDIGAEPMLQEALGLVEPWTSFAHRGYAALALGNHHLVAWLRSEGRDIARVRCAAQVYRKGRKLFRARENPELAMALANNSGVAVAILGGVSGDRALLRKARGLWRLAERGPRDIRRLSGPPLARLAAWHNLSATAAVRARASGSGKKKRARSGGKDQTP